MKESQLETFERFKSEVDDLGGFLAIVEEASEEGQQLREKIEALIKNLNKFLEEIYLSGKYDYLPAFLSIASGAGGRDAEDWACLLLRMYQRYFEGQNWPSRVVEQSLGEAGGPEGRIGIKEVTIEVGAKKAYGLLKYETGVHRLVRLSPFSAKQLRHTSFCSVEVTPKMNNYSEIAIKPEDLTLSFFRASGPGGQNVNKRETAVRIKHKPTGLVVSSQAERTQSQNKEIAMNILASKLAILREGEQQAEIKKIKQSNKVKTKADFGHQIRSYVLHPYKMVKDHRTGMETSDVEGFLDGDIQIFLNKEREIL